MLSRKEGVSFDLHLQEPGVTVHVGFNLDVWLHSLKSGHIDDVVGQLFQRDRRKKHFFGSAVESFDILPREEGPIWAGDKHVTGTSCFRQQAVGEARAKDLSSPPKECR